MNLTTQWFIDSMVVNWSALQAAVSPEQAYEWGWGMHPMWGMWGVWGIGMMIMMFVFWGLVIAGIVLGIRCSRIAGGTRWIPVKNSRFSRALSVP